MSEPPTQGFIGLGAMGKPMADNTSRHLANRGEKLIVHDIAGTSDRAPAGAIIAQSNSEVVRRATVIALSLPSVAVNRAVVEEIAASGHRDKTIVDTCTIGPEAAAENARILDRAGVEYVDAPISGMVIRAEQGTLTSMVAGSPAAIERARALIEGYTRDFFVVGDRAGLGQRMKLVNNALYITNMITVSEALAYGEHDGLGLDTMLAVLAASSGQSFVTDTVFARFMVDPQAPPSGVEAHIIDKDLSLFVDAAKRDGTPSDTIAKAYELMERFAKSDPRREMAGMYRYIRDDEQ